MAALNKFNSFVEYLAEKVFNLETDTLRIALTNAPPAASNTVLADITQIATGERRAAGGAQATVASSGQASGTYKLVLDDVTFTASGGAIGPFRYAVLYDDTPTSPADPLIGWYDYGAGLTLTNGNSFTVDFDAVNGALQIA